MNLQTIKSNIKTFKRTIALLVVTAVFFTSALLFNFEPFEALVDYLEALEKYQADELVLMLPFVLIGILLDIGKIRRHREQKLKIQEQRLHVLKATMTTVHDIVNNFLNNLQIFRIEMEKSDSIDKENIELFDSLIYDTSMKLRAISNLKSTPVKHMSSGTEAIDLEKAMLQQAENNSDKDVK